MTSRRDPAKNLVASLLFFFARVAAVVLQLKLVERFFGAQFAGLNALLNQLTFYVALIELGLAAAAISLLYEPIKSGAWERTSELLFALHRDTSRLILLASPVIAALVYGYARSLHTSLAYPTVLATLALTAASGLITLLAIHYQAYLNASEQIYQVHLVLGAGYLLKTLVGVSLAVKFGNYLWLPAAVVAVTIVEVVTLKWRFHQMFPHYVARAGREAYALIRNRAKYVLFHRVGGLIYYQSDFIILSLVASLTLVKDYAQVQYAVSGAIGLTSAIFNALTATIARRRLDVSTEEQWKQYATVLRTTYFLAGSAAIAFFFTIPTAVQKFFAGGELSKRDFVLFAILLFLNIVKQVDDTLITATGTFNVGFWLPVMESISYAVSGIWLARRFGIEGIVSAGIATNLTFAVVAKSVVVAKGIFNGETVKLMRTKLTNLILAVSFLVPIGGCFLAMRFWSAKSIVMLGVANTLVGLYALAMAYAFSRRGVTDDDSQRNPILKREAA